MNAVIAALSLGLLAVLLTLALYHATRWLALLGNHAGLLPEAPDPAVHDLRDERRRLLSHLQEIQFDFETGKIDAADYHQLRNRCEREVIAVLEALDAQERGGTA